MSNIETKRVALFTADRNSSFADMSRINMDAEYNPRKNIFFDKNKNIEFTPINLGKSYRGIRFVDMEFGLSFTHSGLSESEFGNYNEILTQIEMFKNPIKNSPKEEKLTGEILLNNLHLVDVEELDDIKKKISKAHVIIDLMEMKSNFPDVSSIHVPINPEAVMIRNYITKAISIIMDKYGINNLHLDAASKKHNYFKQS